MNRSAHTLAHKLTLGLNRLHWLPEHLENAIGMPKSRLHGFLSTTGCLPTSTELLAMAWALGVSTECLLVDDNQLYTAERLSWAEIEKFLRSDVDKGEQG
jgi:hypothetical protein